MVNEGSGKERSKQFRATRKQHSSEAAEDYTELIADLIEDKGEARVVDIAGHLGISHVTALRTIARLQRDGFVKTSPRKPVTLTAKGGRLAAKAKERHELLVKFLIAMGVPPQVAEVDAEGAEHHISDTTLECFRAHLENC